jgi:integrase/recombinase XerC
MEGRLLDEWTAFTEDFLTSCRERSRATLTLRTYAADLAAFARWYLDTTGQPANPASVTPLDLAEWRSGLCQRHKPATVNRRLAAMKAAYSWAVADGRLKVNPASQVRGVPVQRTGPRAIDRRALAALLREAQRANNLRDVALISLLAQAGLRVSEALALRWTDLTLRERSGSVEVRAGKGGKHREVPLTLTARRALSSWRDARWPAGSPEPGVAVFPGRGGRGHLTSRGAQLAFVRYSRRAGIDSGVTPHRLRHGFCKALIDAGESIDRVAVLAGHASLQTTALYTKPSAADLEQAVARLEWV